MSESPTPRLLGDLARAALDNASELLGDAKVLLDAGRYPRVLALTVLAAEEFGKHMMCMSAAALDLDSPREVKKFWKRFRSHEAKYQNWHGQMIDYVAIDPANPMHPERREPDLWDDLWSEMPEMVKAAMDMKLRSLYVDEQDGHPTSPRDLVPGGFASEVWKAVSMVVESSERMWDGADLAEHLETVAPRMQGWYAAMIDAKEKGDPGDAVAVLSELLDLPRDEIAALWDSWASRPSEKE